MANKSSDVIVAESEFLNAAAQCKQYCNKLQATINEYQQIMNAMGNYAIRDMLISNKVGIIAFDVMQFAPIIEDIGLEINKLITQYLVDIAEIDNKFEY